MEIEELFNLRKELSIDSRDEYGYITSQLLLSNILPSMLESKLIDSDDYEECFHNVDSTNVTIDGHTFNETQERLQLFILDKETSDEGCHFDDLMISEKKHYDRSFKGVTRFVSSSINGDMSEKLQDSSTARLLVNHLNSPEGLHQIDVVEIFLISLTATVTFKGAEPSVRDMYFEEENITATFMSNSEKFIKEILVIKKVIDLNFLYNVAMSKGNGAPLEVRFDKIIGNGIDAIKAASESHFESYLCVIPAKVLSELYKRYSSRLLEKNVRSFLQFKGVNSGIKKTIKDEPEKFIAYNNGLTITATGCRFSHKKGSLQIQSLTDFQIVNGGQTTATIYFSKKDGLNIDKVKVMAKINIAKNNNSDELEELIANISEYSNAQSRVSKVDLKSRNPELIKLKKLSDTVITPSGKKWFFERAKGEFQTLLRLADKKKEKYRKDYPAGRRFSKELLAKYYSAWGDEPYKVKKGGEKIFRHFIERISKTDTSEAIEINRDFYESAVAKIILFRSMEKIYGQGKNSMGQLRSAVIPYTLSVLYLFSDYTQNKYFDMARIWKNEGLEEDLSLYLEKLMTLMNELIKKYSLSEDYGEYSKKEQLWRDISQAKEVVDFLNNSDSIKIIKKYCKVS